MMMNKHKNPTKLLSLSSKPSSNRGNDHVMQLELQLKEAYSHIKVLKESNKDLLERLAVYERKCEDMRIVQEELEFRREQEKQMQEHLDNYQEINGKLRAQITQMQASLKENITRNAQVCERVPLKDFANDKGHRRLQSTNINENENYALHDSGVHMRRSFGENTKQNHPLTPKTRVNINFDLFSKNGMDQIHQINQINARRKVFL